MLLVSWALKIFRHSEHQTLNHHPQIGHNTLHQASNSLSRPKITHSHTLLKTRDKFNDVTFYDLSKLMFMLYVSTRHDCVLRGGRHRRPTRWQNTKKKEWCFSSWTSLAIIGVLPSRLTQRILCIETRKKNLRSWKEPASPFQIAGFYCYSKRENCSTKCDAKTFVYYTSLFFLLLGLLPSFSA